MEIYFGEQHSLLHPLPQPQPKMACSWFPKGSLSIGTTLLRGMGKKGFVLVEE